MRIRSQGLTSLLLSGTFILAAVSGVALYLKPKGRVANWTGWTFGGLDKSQWEALHANACLLLLVVTAFHLYFNWKPFVSYVKRQTGGLNLKMEMAVAGAALVLLSVGTVLDAPPFSATATLGSRIKDYWEQSAESLGPAPDSHEFSLERFARSIDLPPEELVAILREEGLQFSDSQTTIAQLAADNQLTPAEVYTTITKHRSDAIQQAREERARRGEQNEPVHVSP